MKYCFALLFGAGLLWGADADRLALAARAQSDFDRVELAGAASVRDIQACVQSQAAALPVTAPESRSLVLYRQGYCALVGALIARDPRGFDDAARWFEQATAEWPTKVRGKGAVVEPVPSALGALAAIARLEAAPPEAWAALETRLAAARESAACSAAVMPPALCKGILDRAAAWQGWIAAQTGRPEAAAQYFRQAPAPAWSAWLEGKRAFERGRYAESASALRRATEAWSAAETNRVASIPAGLDPPPDLTAAHEDLAGALLAAGDAPGALRAIEPALRRADASPRAWFLKARAREEAGDRAAAVADFNLAARKALASGDDAAGQAHLYRGVWLLRRSEHAAAEEEFSQALNERLPQEAARDAAAWRALAAVTGGACGAVRTQLAVAAALASPFFPSEEARRAGEACAARPVSVSEAR